MIAIIGWDDTNTRLYMQWAGIDPRSVIEVYEPHDLRGISKDTDVIVLGPPHMYRRDYYNEFVDYLNFYWDSGSIHYDETYKHG